MPKRELKSGAKRQTGKQQEFVEPVVLTPVQVLPEVARDVAARTRALVKQLTGNAGSTKLRVSSATRSRAVAGSKAR